MTTMLLERYTSPQLTVQRVVDKILASGRITRADEAFFLRAIAADKVLSQREMALINRVRDRLQMGLLKLAD
jgi:S1-C subfamily serine protease